MSFFQIIISSHFSLEAQSYPTFLAGQKLHFLNRVNSLVFLRYFRGQLLGMAYSIISFRLDFNCSWKKTWVWFSSRSPWLLSSKLSAFDLRCDEKKWYFLQAWIPDSADIHVCFYVVKAMVKVHLCTFLSLCMPGKICGEHTGEACDEEVRKKTPEFSWRGGGESGRVFRGTPCFCFSSQERESGGSRVQDGGPLAQVTLWMMCVERCLVQLSTLHSKRPFFNPSESHPRARTPLPSKKTLLALPQTPSSFLPCFPWPESKCFMWLDWGRLEVGPRPCPKKTLVFQWDGGVLVLAGWSGGVRLMPPGRGGNKRPRALSHALFLGAPVCTCREVEIV